MQSLIIFNTHIYVCIYMQNHCKTYAIYEIVGESYNHGPG